MQPNQPVMPTSPTPFSTGPNRGGGVSPLLILVIVLGAGALIFAVLTIMFYSQARTATTTLDAQKAAAVAKAKAEQKTDDDAANTAANESPFRSYTAPVEYGSFEIKFPKNWSAWVDQEKSGTQVSLELNPDFVRRTNSTDELYATRVQLIERTSDQYMTSYNSQVQRGALKKADATVSGQKAFDLTGSFQDKRTTRMVVVPVRDKVLVFINENSRYASEFNEILAQSKIIP
jgi:Tfp pilus assembly protein PilV